MLLSALIASAGIIQAASQGLPSARDSLTLEAALASARAHRPALAAAAAQVAGARAEYRVAEAAANPILTYSRTESTPRQHLTLDQPLDWLLRRGADRAAAGAGIARARADSALTDASLVREVRVSFSDVLAAQEAEHLVREQLAIADTLDRIASSRLAAGDISLLERERARLELARARQSYSASIETRRLADAALGRAVGSPAGAGGLLVAVGPLDDGLGLDPSPQQLPADDLPSVRSGVADSAAAAATARSAALARVPLPSIQIGAEWDDPTLASNVGQSVIGLSIPLPIWHTGGAETARARAQASGAAARLREIRLDAARQLQESAIRLDESRRRARFARDAILPVARALRSRALRAYEAGETGILPMLDALSGERDAALAALDDLRAFQQARAEWDALHERTP